MVKHFFTTLVIIAALTSCKSDDVGPQSITQPVAGVLPNGHVVVLNEGLFNAGNASVSLYDPAETEVFHEQYLATNGTPMGDILQSVYELDNRLFFVVNNSGKILVTDKELNHLSTIDGLTSPRYIAESGGKLVVTDLFSGFLSVFDANSLSLEGTIPAEGWTEQVVGTGGRCYVAFPGDDKVQAFDLETGDFDSYPLSHSPNSIVTDNNGGVFALAPGVDVSTMSDCHPDDLFPPVYPIDAANASKIVRDEVEGKYYMMGDAIHSWSQEDGAQLITALDDVETPYGFAYIPELEMFFVGDAKDYTSEGEVFVYSAAGELIDSFTTGSLPNGFHWVGE